jgi:hypothetical protein
LIGTIRDPYGSQDSSKTISVSSQKERMHEKVTDEGAEKELHILGSSLSVIHSNDRKKDNIVWCIYFIIIYFTLLPIPDI